MVQTILVSILYASISQRIRNKNTKHFETLNGCLRRIYLTNFGARKLQFYENLQVKLKEIHIEVFWNFPLTTTFDYIQRVFLRIFNFFVTLVIDILNPLRDKHLFQYNQGNANDYKMIYFNCCNKYVRNI